MILYPKIIFYGSYLVFVILGFSFWRIWQQRSHKIILSIIVGLCLLFIWARFVEPQMIVVRHQQINVGFSAKIALIADIHAGVYKNQKFIEQVVEKINLQNPDYVFIAGDFLFACEDVTKYFAPLSELKAPVYAVKGNHDFHSPNCPQVKLIEELARNGVKILDNAAITLPNFTLLGLSDYMFGRDGTDLLNNYVESDNLIVMAHNPDTTLNYPNQAADLTVCGHTHAGQVRIPDIYKHVIPTRGNFDQGLTRENNTQLFITGGLGEFALPLRFLNPPAIDILDLQ